MNKFKQLWSNMRSSFWFLPWVIVVVSIAFAVALIDADSAGSDRWLAQWPRLFGAGAQGARGMMSTISGSMMSVFKEDVMKNIRNLREKANEAVCETLSVEEK